MSLLALENVSAGYGAGDILKDVSLRVEPGEIVALIGANGVGKTTTMRVVAGLLRPSAGRILIDGKPRGRLRADQVALQGIALVPEGRRIFHTMTVEENLELGALRGSLSSARKPDVSLAYSIFPLLSERREQTAGSLSGGEQQMLALARALLSQPRLLLLDEPSLGLAPKMVQAIFEVIRDIHRRGTTMLLVEQNATLALKTAQRAYVLQTGRIVLSGPCEEIARNEEIRQAYLGKGRAAVQPA